MWKLALIHTFYPGAGRTALQFPFQLFEGPRRPFSQDLDIPVFEVAGYS